MKTLLVASLLLLGAVFVSPRAAQADDVVAGMIEAHADSLVTVKYVLNLQMSFQGQSQEREISGEASGVLVAENGLIVLSGQVFNPSGRAPGGHQIEIKATPTNIRVVFPGDPKEYEAVLGATDTKLGLAFVRIKDLEGRAVKAVDLERTGDVKIGDRLYGVARLPQSFDYAPWCDTVDVVGRVTKPRKMWTLRGSFGEIAHPLFHADGALAGFMTVQEGVGGGRALPFLLPLKVAKSTIERAAKQAEKVLEDEAEEAAEAAEEGAGDDEATPSDAPEGAGAPAEPEKPSEDGEK